FGEFLDAIRFGGAERETAMEDYLKARYRDTPPQMLVALGPEALKFFVHRRDSLFPGVPLVFGGSSMEELGDIQNLKGIAGLPMELKLAPIIEALLAMRPQTREIVLVHGAAESDRNWRDIALTQSAPFADRIKITDFPELPVDELKLRLSQLPPEAAVFYLQYFQSPGGEACIPARIATEIAPGASVPVVGIYDTYVGGGVLGICVSPFEEEGMALGAVIRRILNGEAAESIGILPPNRQRLIVDHRQIKRWKIKDRDVPKGAELRYITPTLWEQHRTSVILTLAVVGLQAILITGLTVARLRQKTAEKELRFSEARFSGVFRGSPSALCIVRQSDGRIVDVNPGWEATIGVPRADAVGRTPLEAGMVIPGDAESRFRQFLEAGKPLKNFEQLYRTSDGKDRLLSLTAELIPLHEEPSFIIVAKDVTDIHELEEARQKLAHTARLALLGEMTASIAHEVNQPLGAILSNAEAGEMLLEGDSPPLDIIKQILADIRRDDLRASDVIKRVRALVGRREVQQVTVDMNGLLRNCMRLVAHDAQRRGVSLVHELADHLPQIQGDPIQIEQVILNFLLNAMDAMKDTPVVARRVAVRSSLKGTDAVQASVEDSGCGVPADKTARVFDSFFTTKDGGMGLGLALARSIAEAHGGYVFAENNASTGATFHLILPAIIRPPYDVEGPEIPARPSDR
ncbi:MAG TPA: ATP-binding protein, partial [Chthoniobacteraceae bacterium]|nr:ATP-binding protein [Chthoniobacteraceae bacterium]